MSEVTAILLSAGDSTRMGFHKLLYRLPNGKTPMEMSFEALLKGSVDKIVIVVNDATRKKAELLMANAGIPVIICDGGETRQESVYAGLLHCNPGVVLIHDAARCLTRPRLVQNCIDSARINGSGVAAIPIRDTVLHVKNSGSSITPLPRDEMLRMQTPQAFDYDAILAAYNDAKASKISATDDSTLFAAAGNTLYFVRGHINNRKLTTPDDLVWLEEHLCAAAAGLSRHVGIRVGYGEDLHALVTGRELILGGVTVPYEKGLLGHSDADVLTHSLMDALLGAASLGDIGRLFPDTDEQYKDARSIALLRSVVDIIRDAGYGIRNVDVTVVAERPRLNPHFPEIRAKLASSLGLVEDCISLKATTTEGLGPEGRGECIRASAIALLFPL